MGYLHKDHARSLPAVLLVTLPEGTRNEEERGEEQRMRDEISQGHVAFSWFQTDQLEDVARPCTGPLLRALELAGLFASSPGSATAAASSALTLAELEQTTGVGIPLTDWATVHALREHYNDTLKTGERPPGPKTL